MGDVAFVPVGTHALPLSAAVGLPQRTACAGRSNQLAPAHLRRFVSGQEQQIFLPDLPSCGPAALLEVPFAPSVAGLSAGIVGEWG